VDNQDPAKSAQALNVFLRCLIILVLTNARVQKIVVEHLLLMMKKKKVGFVREVEIVPQELVKVIVPIKHMDRTQKTTQLKQNVKIIVIGAVLV
jgi:hypothetical protein